MNLSLSSRSFMTIIVRHFSSLSRTGDTECFQKQQEENISELLYSQRVVELKVRPYVVTSLSVSIQANGKYVSILDLRYVNEYWPK